MSKQVYEKLLADYKRSNKDRKLKIAQKSGYKTGDEYKAWLENMIAGGEPDISETPTKKVTKVKPVIHVVDIIDCSGSMSGDKVNAAIKGINSGITELKKEQSVEYTYTICDFSGCDDIKFSYVRVPLSRVEKINFKTRGLTALYDAIGQTLTTMQKNVKAGEKVLVNIYTDGGENGSSRYNQSKISTLIKDLEGQGYTVTFVGTKQDVKFVTSNLSVDLSNSLVYDGSAQGLEKSLMSTNSARASYTASVVAGEDVSKGFYKNIVKK